MKNLRAVSLALALLAAFGCSQQKPAAPPAAPTAAPAAAPARPSAPVRVAFVTNNASDFWKIAEAGTKKAAQDLGVEVLFRIPAAGTAEEQQQIVEDLITTGVAGIAISPKDPANQTAMLNAAAARVHLVTQDSDAPASNRACYIGTDNRAAGRQAGELVKEALPSGGKIIVCVGTLDAQNARDRLEGLKEVVTAAGIEIVDVRTDETDRAKAVANVEDAIVTRPDVTCFVGLWSYNGPAILNGVKAAGKAGQIKIVCFDEEDATLQGVLDGHIYGTIVQQPYEFGYQSVKVLKQLASGDSSVVPADKQIIVPTLAIRKDQAAAFWAELKQRTGKA
jgi:ribose transport system substrate-binding protein